jgi:hypothetical protein
LFPFEISERTVITDLLRLLGQEKLKHIGYGGIALYVRDRFGQEAYTELMAVPEFKAMVREKYVVT